MTYYPMVLKTYPNMHSSFPLHFSLNHLERGYPAHRHDFLEFSYVIDGSGSETINGVRHPMMPGTFTFVLPYQVHELFTDPGSTLVLYNCMFSMELLIEPMEGGFSGMLSDMDQLSSYAQFEGQEMDSIQRLIDDMFQEYEDNERWRTTLLQVKVKEILVRFDRYRRKNANYGSERVHLSKPRNSVWPIIHYIHRNYQENITLSHLAKQHYLSTSRISELIKQTTGQTFVHFLHDLRIRHACSLLVTTEMSIAEIALEVGYSSYKTFSRIFRECKGIVPTEYRKVKYANISMKSV